MFKSWDIQKSGMSRTRPCLTRDILLPSFQPLSNCATHCPHPELLILLILLTLVLRRWNPAGTVTSWPVPCCVMTRMASWC